MEKKEMVTEVINNLHEDYKMDDFATNLATLFSESEADNIAGAVVGVAYKDGLIKTLTYAAEDQNAKDVFGAIFSNMESGLKKFLEVLA